MSDATWLAASLTTADAIAGTVHRRAADQLHLTAAQNIPRPVLDATRVIPRGKGMAGLAWSRQQPVQTCDLQSDTTGDVRPGAKAVDAAAAVAMPVWTATGRLRAVVGFAFAQTDALSDARLDHLAALAATLPEI